MKHDCSSMIVFAIDKFATSLFQISIGNPRSKIQCCNGSDYKKDKSTGYR